MISAIAPSVERLPTHKDLPSSDDLPVDNSYQPTQWRLLIDTVRPHLDRLHPDGKYLAVTDMGIYFKITDPPLKGCHCPDFFYVPGVEPIPPDSIIRNSYVMWYDRISPRLLIELISDLSRGTEYDRTPEEGKFWIYERAIKAENYAIYDPDTATIDLFRLDEDQFKPVPADADGLYSIPSMQLKLGTHFGTYDAMTLNWLWFYTEDGVRFPMQAEIEAERADREKGRADHLRNLAMIERQRTDQEKKFALLERERAEQEKQRADSLAAKLRDLGIDPDKI